jgi:cleavage and polyadenylation specificity factor subunit 3
MTHPTKAIYKWLMQDSVRVQNTHAATSGANDGGGVDQLFNEHDILSTLPQIQTISFNTTHTHNGIRITPYPAGHVLGACMYLIEIAGLNTLFTGDYSRENDRHLIPATIPKGLKVDCLITESTFGISTHIPRAERETALMKSITGILNRGGRALLPVFAIGMAQELLLILEEYWQKHPDYRRYPIYFASALARKCMVVYQTYIDSMNDNIRSKLHNRLGGDSNGETGSGGPWDFQFIRSLKSLDRFDDVGGCVMLASPGMLQNGVSRTLLERWAPDSKNGVVITGYSVEGTMAKEIMKEPDSIPAVMTQRGGGGPMMGKRATGPGGEDKVMIPRRCTVQEFSFAAHVDGAENRAFIEEVDAPVVVLVHGERGNMMRMRSRLLGLGKFKVYSPANCEEVRIPFRREKVAKVVGRLANEVNPQAIAGLLSPPASSEDGDEENKDNKRRKEEGQVISGVLVQNEFKLSLMAPEDLREYAGLNTTTITCRQRITLGAAGIDLIKWSLQGTFGGVAVSTTKKATNGDTNGNGTSSNNTTPKSETTVSHTPDQGTITLSIMNNAVRIYCHPRGELELEWEGNATNDALADAVMAVLLSVETSPAAIKRSAQSHGHGHSHEDQHEHKNMFDGPHPLAAQSLTPTEKLSRLFMFLEAQFGETAITPIAEPKMDVERDDVAIEKELARLHSLGIPVPGLEIKIDKSVAKVWLENLEVDCGNRILGERVRAVVERGCEVLSDVVF